jgi:hypothetical protein
MKKFKSKAQYNLNEALKTEDPIRIIEGRIAYFEKTDPIIMNRVENQFFSTESVSCLHGHKDNFGRSGECLDCMKLIKKGRFEINLKLLSFEYYWKAREFWNKVDIPKDKKGNPITSECWLWTGSCFSKPRPATSKGKYLEMSVRFPSPFHDSTVQTARRVSFWIARGYTGRMRLFSGQGCHERCVNPAHIHTGRISYNKSNFPLTTYDLSYGNIFDTVRKRQKQEQENPTQEVPTKTKKRSKQKSL